MNTLTTTETMEIVDEGAISDTSSDLDSRASSPDPDYNEGNLLTEAMENEVTAQLVAAGVVGVAAAAAITSSKKRKRPHSFETNPSIRKRQQNRLLRKLRVSRTEPLCKWTRTQSVLLSPANDIRVRDSRWAAGCRISRDAGQAQQHLQGIWREASRRRHQEPPEHGDGRAWIGPGPASAPKGSRRSVAVRTSAADNRRHPDTSWENDSSTVARFHSTHAEILDRWWFWRFSW